MKVRDLKRILAEHHATWTVHPSLSDDREVPRRPTGGNDPPLPPGGIPPFDLRGKLANRTNNPHLRRRRIARGYLSADDGDAARDDLPPETGETGETSEGGTQTTTGSTSGTLPAALDWRNRWGTSWVTTIRDQGDCNACWAFATTALVESMVRIEHDLWCWRSEGDLHAGMHYECSDAGNPDFALGWVYMKGLADPACFPWEKAVSDSADYTPTSDRPGRIVKIPSYEMLSNAVAEQKEWLDLVGPLITRFYVYKDFRGYGSGVYRHDPATEEEGEKPFAHYMLIVGYDDARGCWIVKNSWGAEDWGEKGFGYIAYGECGIDDSWPYKWGLQFTEPDAWTRRRQHAGSLIETIETVSDQPRDRFILLEAKSNLLRPWRRENSEPGKPWKLGPPTGGDAASFPTLTATTFGGNYECVHRTTTNRLRHRFFDQASQSWQDGIEFGPSDVAGVPGFLQSSYSAPGYFEVVVRTADSKLNFWFRINKSPWTWNNGGRFGSGVAFSGPTLVQHSSGNLELVCVHADGQMQHWHRDGVSGPWKVLSTFGSAVKSPPCMIIGQTGAANERQIGNYELCVAVGGRVQHWFRDLAQPAAPWVAGAAFGHDVTQVAGLLQGSFSFNLEVVVQRTDKKLQHYWRQGGTWREGVVFG